jgi:hypothetical protein
MVVNSRIAVIPVFASFKFDFVYNIINITSSVWRNGLSVLKTTAFLVYPPHFYKYNCNKHCHLTLETVNFEQPNARCERNVR